MSDKRKFLYSASIAYVVLIFILLPISLMVQGSEAHEASVFVMVTVLFSLPVAFGLLTIGYPVFSYIKNRITFNHFVGVVCGAVGVSIVLAGIANIIGFVVVGEISSDMAGFFLYPTLIVCGLATVVYFGFEKWS